MKRVWIDWSGLFRVRYSELGLFLSVPAVTANELPVGAQFGRRSHEV